MTDRSDLARQLLRIARGLEAGGDRSSADVVREAVEVLLEPGLGTTSPSAVCNCPTCQEARAYESTIAWYEPTPEERQRRRQADWDLATAKRQRRIDAGVGVCRAHTNEGRLCNGSPIRGSDLCSNHADDDIRAARDYGRYLAELAVDDSLCSELAGDRPWFAVIEANRRDAVLTELRRQIAKGVPGAG